MSSSLSGLSICMAVLFGFAACTDQRPQQPTTRVGVSTNESVVEPDSVFALVGDVLLSPKTRSPLVGLSGAAIDNNGRIIVTDASEANVQVFDSTGTWLFTIGRRGSGPGEFQVPAFPMVDASGRFHIVDIKRRVIGIFATDGRLIREVTPKSIGHIDQVAVNPTGGYLIVGSSTSNTNNDILFFVDSVGETEGSALELRHAIPSGSRQDADWRVVRRASLTTSGNRAYVVHTLLDSIWTIDLRDKTITVETLHHPHYVRPSLASSANRNRLEIMAWVERLTLVAAVVSTVDATLVAYSSGPYFDQVSTFASVRDGSGEWRSIERMPPIIGRGKKVFVARLASSDMETRIGLYEMRAK